MCINFHDIHNLGFIGMSFFGAYEYKWLGYQPPSSFSGQILLKGEKEANKWDFVVVCAVLLSSGDIHPTIGAIPLVPLTAACASPAVPMHCVAHMER